MGSKYTVPFKIPTVKSFVSELTFTKVDQKGNPIGKTGAEGGEFTLSLTDATNAYQGMTVECTLTGTADGKAVEIETVSLTYSDKTTEPKVWEKTAKRSTTDAASNQQIQYSITETPIDGCETPTVDYEKNLFIVSNTVKNERDIVVTKEWVEAQPPDIPPADHAEIPEGDGEPVAEAARAPATVPVPAERADAGGSGEGGRGG